MPRAYTKHTAEERNETTKTKLAFWNERLAKTNAKIEKYENIKDSILEKISNASTKLDKAHA